MDEQAPFTKVLKVTFVKTARMLKFAHVVGWQWQLHVSSHLESAGVNRVLY